MSYAPYIKRLFKWKKLLLAMFAAVTLITIVGTLIPGDLDLPDTVWSYDKAGHFLMFLAWTLLFGIYRFIQTKEPPNLWFVLLAALIFGLVIEILQLLLPINRSAELYDFMADAGGSVTAIAIIYFIFRPSEKEHS